MFQTNAGGVWTMKVTGAGQPGHPLYMHRNLEPRPWRGVR